MASNQEAIQKQVSADFDIFRNPDEAVISVDECKELLRKYDLSDEQLLLIRNTIIGITDSVINCYIDEHF